MVEASSLWRASASMASSIGVGAARTSRKLRTQSAFPHAALAADHHASRFIATAPEALASDIRGPVFFLDLGPQTADTEITRFAQEWIEHHPGAAVVLFAPIADVDGGSRPLSPASPLGWCRILPGGRAADDKVWEGAREMRERAALTWEVVTDFHQATTRWGHVLPALPLVLRLLAETPTLLDVYTAAAKALGHGLAAPAARRKAVWRCLYKEGQLPASRLVLVFRLLWYVKLRSFGWQPRQLAEFLGFSSARQLRLSLARRSNVTMRVLRALSYDRTLRWAVETCALGARSYAGLPTAAMFWPLVYGTDSADASAPPALS
jgi:hypothetical protein